MLQDNHHQRRRIISPDANRYMSSSDNGLAELLQEARIAQDASYDIVAQTPNHGDAWGTKTVLSPSTGPSSPGVTPSREDAFVPSTGRITSEHGNLGFARETPAMTTSDTSKLPQSLDEVDPIISKQLSVTKNSTARRENVSEYLDLSPQTPRNSQSPAGSSTDEASCTIPDYHVSLSTRSQSLPGSKIASTSDHQGLGEEETNEGSHAEIQNIMDQFENGNGDGREEAVSFAADVDNSKAQTSVVRPPRTSSLEPIKSAKSEPAKVSHNQQSIPSKPGGTSPTTMTSSTATNAQKLSNQCDNSPQSIRFAASESQIPLSPQSSHSLPTALPPEPDPEPDLPFDFHRFLEQLRHRTADPVAKFLRSFLVEFGKKQWMVHEQVKIISDFLAFITNKMAQCEVWRGISNAEFDNAREGMEKLVMNRLYSQTFSPAIPPSPPAQDGKGKRKNTENLPGPARRGQHQEDIERDDILAQKVKIYGWVQEEHLDIAAVGVGGRRFLSLAQQGKWNFFHSDPRS